MHSLEQSALKMERDCSPVDTKTVGERKPLGGRVSLPAEYQEPLHDHQILNLLPPPVNLPHEETCVGEDSGESSGQASSNSQWSEVGQHYGGSSTFCCFSLAMAEQCLRGEELRARHQAALLELRKKALQEKARAELAWLSHQKRCLESLQDSEGASAMAAKQCKILTELKQEQAEIQHLQNIYRAAHQERKLLLKQQRDILRMQHSTAQLKEKLHNMTGNQEVKSFDVLFTHNATTEEAIMLNAVRLTSSPKLYHSSSSAEPAAHPERSDLSGSRVSCVQLKNKQRDKYEEGFSPEHKTLAQYQKEAEESPGLEQSLGGQGPDASETVAKKVCCAASQTTSSVIMMKDCKNPELNAQGALLSPLEQANSTRMHEPVSTTITREGRKRAFWESVLEEKAFISNPETDPKDNEDINSCDSRFTGKGLEMLSTLCNLCLSHAENTPQGTVKEGEVPVPYKTHQVDDSWCLKQLDRISHEASEELNLKTFSEGLASTELSPKSNNFSPRCRSTTSDSLLPEFQKVSALWIDISESSISDSVLQLKNEEDTDVSIPEEFVCDNGDAPRDVSKETLIAIGTGKEMLPSGKPNEHEVSKDDSSETSPLSQKCPGAVSDHSCTDNFLSFIPSDKANAFKMKSADYSQSDSPAKRRDEPHLDASGNYSRNKTCSEDITKQGGVASSSCSDDIYSLKNYEQQNLSSTTSRVEKDDRVNSLFVDQNTNIMGFPLTGSLKHLDLATDQLRNTVSFPASKETTENKLLACFFSGNLPISGGKNHHAQLLNERLASSIPVPGISEAIHTEPNSLDSLQRVATGNQSNSPTERQAMEEERREQFSSVPSKKQLFQAENGTSRGEDDTLISDEGLPPADEDTLLEILSPVDEVLSYGSADLPSSNKKDLSFPSEDLPPPPLGADAMKNDDSTFSTDDFPSPPEQMIVSETRQHMDEDTSLKMDVLPPLLHGNVPEGFPLLNRETTDTFSTLDSSCSEQSLVKGIPSAKEGLLEYQQGEHETPLQHLESLPVLSPISPSQASKSPDFTVEHCKPSLTLPKAEEDSDDPLLSFKIGDRVLVKQTQPGTLMFKGQTCFDSGHWAGVALDKAEGDHAGTYKGVKYFECAQHCGIFVRPDEISHLLEANENGSIYTGDEDSDTYDDESFKGDCKYSEYDNQGGGLPEQKAEDPKSTGGSEVKENQSRLHVALLSGKGEKHPRSDQYKCNEFLCRNNFRCLESDKGKTELTQLEQRMLADVLPVKNETGNTGEINTSKNICCLVGDQKRNKLADDIANEIGKNLPFETLTAFSAAAQHKYKNAFEKDTMNYGKGLRQDNNQKMFLLKENPIALLFEQSAKISDVLLSNSNILSIHGCHTAAERIVTKFVDDTVKEYMKIKRKHGSKPDKIFHSSSETSPATLPFLIKILDAGIFGSSEDFEQPISDQHMLVKQQTPKQYLYKLDQWHSAPWKKTVEVPLVIPHCSSYVKKLSACVVEQLWTPANIYSNFKRISVPKHLECNNLLGNDLETESKRMYDQVIFDLTHELLRAEYRANANTFPWMKENLGSYCSRHLCRGTDVSEVKKFVQGEITKTMNLEKNDLEMKRKFLNMTKYGNYKRDRVDLVLIQELRKEESRWTCYDDDELTVKMRMTEDIFDSLIHDTIGILNKIYLRKAHD
ncbi:centrosome-associated protein 350-like [Phaenicophaeus curvirostris]|uniref:centrosome-associated protein 350-like n=1 Tax=Phaenicophaeus curvirostris TaxID=33595 RepID=UPI0037F0C486